MIFKKHFFVLFVETDSRKAIHSVSIVVSHGLLRTLLKMFLKHPEELAGLL
jgi:hypothetical protein